MLCINNCFFFFFRMRSQTQRAAPISEKDLTQVSKTYVSNMLQLLRDGGASTSDYKVVADEDGREFAVHKCILAAHSDVFRAMFEHSGTIESERSTLRIDEFSSDAIGAMLEYIYTGCCSSSTCRPQELLGLADKYNLTYLKCCCEEQLIAKVTKENVCEMLMLADLYRSDSLKQVAMTFTANYRKEVTNCPDWMHLKEKQPALANEVLEYLLEVAVGDTPPDAKRPRMD